MDLVFIHGPAAAGKLTTAKALAAITGYPLFHNHLIVDAVSAVFPFGSAPFVRLRQQFWLETFAAAAEAGRPLIFTFAPEPTVPADFVGRAVAVVEAAGGRVRFVQLLVADDEQERRVVAADRAAFNKLRSVEVLRRLQAAAKASGFQDRPPADLVIDTAQSSAEQSARTIIEAFALLPLAVPHRPFGD